MRKTIIFLLLIFPALVSANPGSGHEEEELEADIVVSVEGRVGIVSTVPTSQQITNITREDIEQQNPRDFPTLLQNAGLNITTYGAYGNQSSVSLRGFDSKRIAILINGIPAKSSLDGKFDFNQIDLNSIEKIEIIHGGSDSKYNVSGAFGGVINIITVAPKDPGLRVLAEVSNTSYIPMETYSTDGSLVSPQWQDLLDTQKYALFTNYGSPDGFFSLSGSFFSNQAGNHFNFEDQYSYQRRKINNEISDFGGSLSLIFNTESLTKYIYSSDYYYGDFNFPTTGFSIYYGAQQDFSARQNILIETPRAFHDNLSSELSVGWHYSNREYIDSSSVTSIHTQNRFLVINRWAWSLSDISLLRSGYDYTLTIIDSTEIGDRHRHDGGFYIAAELQIFDFLLIIPSSKIIFTSDSSSDFAIVPKLGFLWTITDSFFIRNNYFRNFKFPEFEELYWTGSGGIGNPDLLPEDGWGADLGITWHISDNVKLNSAVFAQYIKNSIHWFGSGSIWRPENVGKAFNTGADNSVSISIPIEEKFLSKVELSLSYQFLLTYLLSFGYSFEDAQRIPYSPEHIFNCISSFFWKSGSLSFIGQYKGLHYEDRANLKELPSIFLLNICFNQSLSDSLLMFSNINNVLNTNYDSYSGYPAPGISITIGVKYSIEMLKGHN